MRNMKLCIEILIHPTRFIFNWGGEYSGKDDILDIKNVDPSLGVEAKFRFTTPLDKRTGYFLSLPSDLDAIERKPKRAKN